MVFSVKGSSFKDSFLYRWKPFEISLQKLCNGKKDADILITLFNFNTKGDHSYIGNAKMSFSSMTRRYAFKTYSQGPFYGWEHGGRVNTFFSMLRGSTPFKDLEDSSCIFSSSLRFHG